MSISFHDQICIHIEQLDQVICFSEKSFGHTSFYVFLGSIAVPLDRIFFLINEFLSFCSSYSSNKHLFYHNEKNFHSPHLSSWVNLLSIQEIYQMLFYGFLSIVIVYLFLYPWERFSYPDSWAIGRSKKRRRMNVFFRIIPTTNLINRCAFFIGNSADKNALWK